MFRQASAKRTPFPARKLFLDDADGLVIAADDNHWVWRGAFPGGQVDPVTGQDISCPQEIEACNPSAVFAKYVADRLDQNT